MEFLAATKDGIFVMDALNVSNTGASGNWRTGVTAEGSTVKVVAELPSPPNAFGHCWSSDGELLASVCDEGVRVYDASKGYEVVREVQKVAEDVGGRAGGVRNVMFSPHSNYLVTYEKWDPVYPENVHIWALTGEQAGTKLRSCVLKGYTSGALPLRMIQWTEDESVSMEMMPGKGLILRTDGWEEEGEGVKVIAEKNASNYELSPPNEAKGTTYIAFFTPESSTAARVSVYDVSACQKTLEFYLPAKIKDCRMIWNFDGTGLLILATSDVDETGNSYFGTSYLYWMKPDSKAPVAVYGAKEGQVQDIAWSPTANEFIAIVGAPPSTVALHDGKTSKLTNTLGKARRNTLKWNPFGKFLGIGGFGTLAGDLDFYDRSKDECIASLRAPLTVGCEFGPDGRHFLACTVAPRMNEGNQISMYKYTGELLFKIDYVPEVIEGRHEDTGAGARTKTQALLFAASWRPVGGSRKYEDRAASPPKSGKRKKGLPEATAVPSASGAGAYRAGGGAAGGMNLVAAMMRGEIQAAERPAWTSSSEQGPTTAPMEEWEVKKLMREAEKAAAAKAKEEEAAALQARKDTEKAELKDERQLKKLKAQLEEIEKAKDKDWDELTEEDEALMEEEVDIRAKIKELEKRVRA
mmetsp:Transcript_56173/g.119589  ORF Transcript_56173/g.119589 Transcript_56173/m.119589 type:complete len:637 (+) Transcript_56173:170-2080(+)|eukprot:CAMPEP_0206459234 /NCGR_PEP_ID=MMETSP0324_2-20121206/24058_1 /ASSEMBLY_ACC=CAM_ASM_000836 /TAXON_ID=2866 /ORGANISM="Crypthecodinium cohnii, Strain Seligo" /LENGTH=636 /DNA_ID=CAMNT_0053930753 /DNA_START=165 /DNA_END=2075 /DNA_ORIENTATION=+